MRVVGDIPHPVLKITVFKNDGRYSLKFESGMVELTYKFRDDERLATFEDMEKLVDASFLEKIDVILRGMSEAKMETLSRNLPQLNEEEFDVII